MKKGLDFPSNEVSQVFSSTSWKVVFQEITLQKSNPRKAGKSPNFLRDTVVFIHGCFFCLSCYFFRIFHTSFFAFSGAIISFGELTWLTSELPNCRDSRCSSVVRREEATTEGWGAWKTPTGRSQ